MQNKKGFTLMEVLVVTIIIAALALLVIPSFKNSALTNQMEKAKIGLVELTTAVKLYNEVNTEQLSGVLRGGSGQMFDKLTNEEDPQGYIYLRNKQRWDEKPNSSNREMSLKDGNGVLNCRYFIGGQASSLLSSVTCEFNKLDSDNNETECYRFYINKANPDVLKKESINCENISSENVSSENISSEQQESKQ